MTYFNRKLEIFLYFLEAETQSIPHLLNIIIFKTNRAFT